MKYSIEEEEISFILDLIAFIIVSLLITIFISYIINTFITEDKTFENVLYTNKGNLTDKK